MIASMTLDHTSRRPSSFLMSPSCVSFSGGHIAVACQSGAIDDMTGHCCLRVYFSQPHVDALSGSKLGSSAMKLGAGAVANKLGTVPLTYALGPEVGRKKGGCEGPVEIPHCEYVANKE